MTQKVTISVPDELHERMQKWKGSMNFSRIFQDSISTIIQKKEDFLKRITEDPKMNEIIERLRQEKEKSQNDWFEIGEKEGLEWVKHASYDEIQIALSDETREAISNDESIIDMLIEYDAIDADWYNDFIESKYRLSRDSPFTLYFERGFMSGVQKFWDEVKDKI